MDDFIRRMYEVLNLSESATISEIEEQYRRLVHKYQAGQSTADAASRQEAWNRLKEISSAYEVVKKYWSEKNIPRQTPDNYLRSGPAAPACAVGKKRSVAPTVIVIGLICIAIVYYGHGFLKRHDPPVRTAGGELRLFMTSR